MATVQAFMDSALVKWVGTFKQESLTYEDLHEGVFLNRVMFMIDSSIKIKDVDYFSLNCSSRLLNFDRLLHNISNFYQQFTHQLIVMKLPNIVTIAREPESEAAVEELNTALLLLLGCAVQCDRKEEYVNKIKGLDVCVQEELVESIKMIADCSGCMVADSAPDGIVVNDTTQIMYNNLKQLVAERNEYYAALSDVHQDLEYYRGLSDKHGSITSSAQPHNGRTIEGHHVISELTQCRLTNKALQDEIEDKGRQIAELTRDLDDREIRITKLRLESCRLAEEKDALTNDRDEVEILREKAELADKFESEIFHLKQKVAELDFYKNRLDEFRVDNSALLVTRTHLETKLEKSSRRCESLIDEVVKYQLQEDEYKVERDQTKLRIQNMMEENASMEKEKSRLLKQLRQERAQAECQLTAEGDGRVEGPSLSEELLNSTFSEQMLELQIENERLRDQLDRLRDEMEHDAKWRCMELQRKITFLQAEVSKAKEKEKSDAERFQQSEMKVREASRRCDRLEEEMAMLRDSHEGQSESYQAHVDDLGRQVLKLRRRQVQDNEVRYKEMERENVEMFQSVQNLSTQVTRLKYNNRLLRKSCDKLKEDVDRSAPYTDENERLRTENNDLRHAAASARVAVDVSSNLESRNLRLEIEIRKLRKLVNILKTTLSQVDPLNRISYHYVTSL